MCKADTVLCCKGYFLTAKQKDFIGMSSEPSNSERIGNHPFEDDQEEEYASGVEKFCSQVFAEKILQSHARVTILVAWVAIITVAIYGVMQLKTEFSMSLFIPKGSPTEKFYQMDLRSFQTGFDVALVVNNQDIDYSTEESQL